MILGATVVVMTFWKDQLTRATLAAEQAESQRAIAELTAEHAAPRLGLRQAAPVAAALAPILTSEALGVRAIQVSSGEAEQGRLDSVSADAPDDVVITTTVPVLFGVDRDPMGELTVEWENRATQAALAANTQTVLIVGGALFTIGAFVMLLLASFGIARPLNGLAEARASSSKRSTH